MPLFAIHSRDFIPNIFHISIIAQKHDFVNFTASALAARVKIARMKDQLIAELEKSIDPDRAERTLRYFGIYPGGYGEGDILLGIPTPYTRKCAKDFNRMPLAELRELLQSPVHEYRFAAVAIMKDQYRKNADEIIKLYLDNLDSINNWDLVDCFAPHLIGLFTETPQVIAIGSKVLRTVMWILPFVGAVSMSRMSFQAMGKPLYAFAITLVRQLFLYVPLLLILDRRFGFAGMIWAQPVTEVIMMAVSVCLLVCTIRRAMRTMPPEQPNETAFS